MKQRCLLPFTWRRTLIHFPKRCYLQFQTKDIFQKPNDSERCTRSSEPFQIYDLNYSWFVNSRSYAWPWKYRIVTKGSSLKYKSHSDRRSEPWLLQYTLLHSVKFPNAAEFSIFIFLSVEEVKLASHLNTKPWRHMSSWAIKDSCTLALRSRLFIFRKIIISIYRTVIFWTTTLCNLKGV
jgi:hypothetical protein